MRNGGTHVYLGLGSNVGDRRRNLEKALQLLTERGVRIVRESRIRETEPFGVVQQPLFLNEVVEARWPGSARQLLETVKDVEDAVGRRPSYRWGPREIDVDILLFGDDVIDEKDLQVPHPGLDDRVFVLEPLVELNPQLTHPLTGARFAELLERLLSANRQGATPR